MKDAQLMTRGRARTSAASAAVLRDRRAAPMSACRSVMTPSQLAATARRSSGNVSACTTRSSGRGPLPLMHAVVAQCGC